MPRPRCIYCDIPLTHDSLSVRQKHMSGKRHIRSFVQYWERVAKELEAQPRAGAQKKISLINPLDQSEDLKHTFKIPGLDDDADAKLDSARIPAPANLPTKSFGHSHLG